MAGEMKDLVLNIITNAESASRQLRKFNRNLDDSDKKIKRVSKSTNLYARQLKNLFVGFLGIQGVRSFVETVREVDLIQRSIVGLTKSTQDWNYIQQQALRTGTRIKDVAKGYRNFYAAASMAGFEKTSIQGMYGDVLTATRSIGASPQQTAGALLALEQMISKGKVSMEELRRQLGNALPGAFEIGAKAMKMTTAEFNDFVSTGKLASTEFVPKFIAQLKKEYVGSFENATKSMDYALNNLSTSWIIFQYEFSKGGFAKGFVDVINQLSKLLISPDLKVILQFVGDILSAIMKIVAHIIGFVSKHLPLIIGLLGVSSLAKVLMMNVGLFSKLLQFMSLCFGGKMVLAIKNITKGLWAMSAPMLKFYGIALAVIAVLAILQDLFYALPFMQKRGYKSAFADLADTINNPPPQSEYEEPPIVSKKFTMPKTQDMTQFLPITQGFSNAQLNKTNTNTFNTTVNIQGSTNMSETQLNDAFTNALTNAFNSYGLVLGGD